MRRLHLPIALAAIVLVTGCGDQRPAAVARADRTPSATPLRPVVDRMHELAVATPASGIPQDFPLTRGLKPDVDPTVTGPGRDVPGVSLENLCGGTAWPGPAERRTDRLAALQSLPWWQAARELVTYDTERHTSAVLTAVRHDLAGCPSSAGPKVTTYEPHTGHDSVTWTVRDGKSVVVVQLVRVGRAVVATTDHQDYADPTQELLDNAVVAVTGDLTPVTSLMECGWGVDGCDPVGDAFTLTPHGATPFTIGMSIAEAREAAPNAVIDGDGRSCAELSWTGRSGAHVHGAFSPGLGLAYLSVDSGATTEGVEVGGTLAELRATYPDLGHADNGLWYSDQGATDYAFEVNEAHVIDWMLVIADDQHCAS